MHAADGQAIDFDVATPFLYQLLATPDDVDAQGHVNNAVYLQWMDAAAFAHSKALGYDWAAYRALGASFVVRRHEVDYLASVLAHQQLVVATWPCRMHRFTAWRRHQIIRLDDGQTVVRAATKWVFLDLNTGRPRRMPDKLIAAFRPRTQPET